MLMGRVLGGWGSSTGSHTVLGTFTPHSGRTGGDLPTGMQSSCSHKTMEVIGANFWSSTPRVAVEGMRMPRKEIPAVHLVNSGKDPFGCQTCYGRRVLGAHYKDPHHHTRD